MVNSELEILRTEHEKLRSAYEQAKAEALACLPLIDSLTKERDEAWGLLEATEHKLSKAKMVIEAAQELYSTTAKELDTARTVWISKYENELVTSAELEARLEAAESALSGLVNIIQYGPPQMNLADKIKEARDYFAKYGKGE